MKNRDLGELFILAALWGASFLFMRLGAGDFGPLALAEMRVAVATATLLPVLYASGQAAGMWRHWKPIFIVGILNSALPFVAYSYAALSITAGLASIFNATTPLWGALIAWLWLRDGLTPARVAGLAIGFAGVLGLAWEKASFKPGGSGWAIVACLAATFCYGLAASFTKRYLSGVPALAVATGSQLAAALSLAVPAALWWPAVPPAAGAWGAAVLLGVLCTGIAYVMYFRLIAHVGPANAIAVTFLVPAFAVLWGWVFLGEALTPAMAVGCAVILAGTSLATGVVKVPAWTRLGGSAADADRR